MLGQVNERDLNLFIAIERELRLREIYKEKDANEKIKLELE